MGEASKILSVKDHVLRYWEKSFKQYFAVERISGRRMFQKNSSDVIFKFLDEKSTLRQDFQIMRSFNVVQFVSALWKRLF